MSGAVSIDTSLFSLLAILVAVLAGLGVLFSVLMATRERVHELGVFKAVGMTPRQAIVMVICWVIAPTIVAAVISLPAGLITADLLVLLTLAGLAIAIAGALGPAGWAAGSRTTTALHTE
jgi:putative ABC transport system permease protein